MATNAIDSSSSPPASPQSPTSASPKSIKSTSSASFAGSTDSASAAAPIPLSTFQKRRRLITASHRLHSRYRHQTAADDSFYCHSKHVFLFTWSGRPVYSRYGDDSRLAAYMGVLTAIIENFRRIHRNATLSSVTAGVWTIAFRAIGPIYGVCVSRTGESVSILQRQIDCVYKQMLTLLTGGIIDMVEKRPQYDIRNVLGGNENVLTSCLEECDKNISFEWNAFLTCRLSRPTRQRLLSALRKCQSNLLYAFVVAGPSLAQMARQKERPLHASDYNLFCNFIRTSANLHNSDSWQPICLPEFSSRGFVYAYVAQLADDVILALLTTDPNEFASLRSAKTSMVEFLTKKKHLEEVASRAMNPYISFDELDFTPLVELRHFMYRNEENKQMIMSNYLQPYADARGRRELWRRHQVVTERMEKSEKEDKSSVQTPRTFQRVQLYWEVTEVAALLGAVRPGEYQIIATFLPSVEKATAMFTLQKLIKWVKKEETTLFL